LLIKNNHHLLINKQGALVKKIILILALLMFDLTLLSQQKLTIPKDVCEAKYINSFTRIPVPSIYRDRNALFKVATVNISANFIGAWPNDAKTAFNYALDIWRHLINSSIPIRIKAEWASLEAGILGAAGATSYKKNFLNAPVADVNYPISLAEALSGTELNGSEEEEIMKLKKDGVGKGSRSEKLKTDKLPAGVYIVELLIKEEETRKETRSTKKISIIKP